jgi:acyl-coenzyme A thioesterase PaaI-like protein
MDKSRSSMQLGAVALAALVMVACGGGGGGGGDGAPGTLDITAGNKDTVARAMVVGIQGGSVLDSAGGLVAAPSVVTRGRDAALRALRTPSAAAREQAQGVIDLGVDSCDLAGTIAGTLDDQDGNGDLSLGETLTFVFTECRDDATEELNGTLAMTITAAAKTPLSFTANATMSNLVVSSTSSSRSVGYSGGFTLTFAQTSASAATTRMRVGNSLAVQVSHPLYTDTVTLQSGYDLRLDYDGAVRRTTVRAIGNVASAQAAGTVAISTAEPIVQDDSESHPHQGVVEALGKNGSVVLRALSDSQIQIDFDQGDGGTYEDSDVVDWDFFL